MKSENSLAAITYSYHAGHTDLWHFFFLMAQAGEKLGHAWVAYGLHADIIQGLAHEILVVLFSFSWIA